MNEEQFIKKPKIEVPKEEVKEEVKEKVVEEPKETLLNLSLTKEEAVKMALIIEANEDFRLSNRLEIKNFKTELHEAIINWLKANE